MVSGLSYQTKVSVFDVLGRRLDNQPTTSSRVTFCCFNSHITLSTPFVENWLVMRGVIQKVAEVGRGGGRSSLHSHPPSCCLAPGVLSAAPPPENAALRSAAGSTLERDKDGGQMERLGTK